MNPSSVPKTNKATLARDETREISQATAQCQLRILGLEFDCLTDKGLKLQILWLEAR